MKTIWTHSLVKNEERYLWFSVVSVINFVDKVLIWDTGSTDKTVEIITQLQKIYPHKIELKEIGIVDEKGLSGARQKMLEESDCDWILILDGDEVWWQDSIKRVVATILYKGDKLDSIVTPYINLIGDIYHHQEERAGRYQIDGRVGHLTIRAINKNIQGLHVEKPYGEEGYFDSEGTPIQERLGKGRGFINASYMHFSHLKRGRGESEVIGRIKKRRYEMGEAIPLDYFYPEVFFQLRPKNIPSPWVGMDKKYYWLARLITPIKKIKRRLFR